MSLEALNDWLSQSELREGVLWALRNVPGLPPIVQTIHIAAVAVVMGSAGFVALRTLGIALRSQGASAFARRMLPFTWWALLILLATGLPFVIARPDRYLFNPIVAWKLGFVVGAIACTALAHRAARVDHGPTLGWQPRAIAALALIMWIGAVFAGRWIAYVDYIYWS